ncbi:hypothetical protein ACJIZ3_014872 [Penstemon smallii]|uniref:Transmembrane protein n=1 Tax=Penstemon smallii TaxID=265156 RepID=A0ABD3RKZ1_9LAMI
MDSQTLVIKPAQKKQFFSMFYLRGIFCYLVAVLLSAVYILASCKQCSVNEGPNQLKFETSGLKQTRSPDGFQIKYDEGVVPLPSSIPQVANLTYAHLRSSESNMNCKLLELIHDIRNYQIEISCENVISVCFGRQFDSSAGYVEEFCNFIYINGKQRPLSSVLPTSEIEAVDARRIGGYILLLLLEGSDPMQTLEFKLKIPTRLNFSSAGILLYMGNKSYSCSQPLTKEVYTKNTGDLPLEVIQIKVSGAERGLYGFLVDNRKGCSLEPGESVRLRISYQNDFPTATIWRDLSLATSIPVIPMEASLPVRIHNYRRRSVFWVIASALFLFVCVLLSRTPAFEDFKSGKSSVYTIIINALNVSHNLKKSAMSQNGFEEEFFLQLEPTSPIVNPSEIHQKQTHSLMDTGQETNLVSTLPSKSSSVENSDMPSDSQSLRVKVGKESGRRRRKKISSGSGVVLFEVSSSPCGNSTPSSPSSPVACKTPKSLVSPRIEQSVNARNPFSQALDLQRDKSKCSEASSKVNILDNEMSLRTEKPSLTRKVAGRAFLLPSATFPSAGRAVPTSTCESPPLASTSSIAPYARAPGPKIHNIKTSKLEEKMNVEDRFTYDIWADHLFGPPLAYQSNGVSTNKSQSFFVRDPQTL